MGPLPVLFRLWEMDVVLTDSVPCSTEVLHMNQVDSVQRRWLSSLD